MTEEQVGRTRGAAAGVTARCSGQLTQHYLASLSFHLSADTETQHPLNGSPTHKCCTAEQGTAINIVYGRDGNLIVGAPAA